MQIPQLYLIYALAGIVLLLFTWISLLEWRISRLTRGVKKKNIEMHLADIVRDYQDLNNFKKEIYNTLAQLDTRLKHTMKGVGTVRFHPFAGSGSSKPSFATAIVSEEGNGFIISTLHAHNSLSIFNKTIENFSSEKELTDEEKKALAIAKKSLHSQ